MFAKMVVGDDTITSALYKYLDYIPDFVILYSYYSIGRFVIGSIYIYKRDTLMEIILFYPNTIEDNFHSLLFNTLNPLSEVHIIYANE